ncbi:MAG: ABC transporter substrate-binding protein [Candidatus Omnitrophota bacterium]
MHRREFLKQTILTGAAAIATASTGFSIHARSPETVRIGYLPITDATPLLIAHANKYFEDEGLNAAHPALIRSWSALTESFLAGKFNVVHLLLPIPIWMRYKNKLNVKIVAWDHLNGSALTVGNGMNMNGFSDLGGKRIAVPHWYSMHNVLLQMGIRKAGLKPVIKPASDKINRDEVNLTLLPPPEMPPALAARQIHGYMVAEPFNAVGELRLNAKIMRFTGDMWKNHPCCVIVMKEDLIKSNPRFTQKVVNAVVRAQQWILHHPDQTAGVLCQEGKNYLPMSKAILQRVFTQYDPKIYGNANKPQAIRHPQWGIQRIGFQPYPFPSATRFIFNQMKQTLVQGENDFLQRVSPDTVVKDLVVYEFAKKAILQLGGAGTFTDIKIDPKQALWDREEVIDI